MAGKPGKSVLGRGLGALIPTSDTGSSSGDLPPSAFREVSVDAISVNPNQPRVHFDTEAIADLSASIKAIGVLQPLLVRETGTGKYELIAGERRWRAAKMAGLATVPVVVRETSDQSSVEEALVENLHRKDLTPLEEAGAYQQLISDFKLTHEQVAGRVGKSRAVITNTLRLLDLPPKVQKYLAMGEIGSGHGKVLLGIADNGTVEYLAKQCVDEGWTVRQLEDAVHNASGRAGTKPKPIRPIGPGSVRDAALVELESLLGEHLSTNVAVSLSGKRGKIVIDFADIADLERIYRLMA